MLDVSAFEVRLRFEGGWSMPISADVLALAFLGLDLTESQQATSRCTKFVVSSRISAVANDIRNEI